jgi:hypothetical protein
LDDFKRALARVQRDFGFYIGCQTEPAAALAGYDLSPAERRALIEPDTLSEMLRGGIGVSGMRPSITVKISGSHDWVNRAMTTEPAVAADRDARLAAEVEAVRRAGSERERTAAVVRLLELIG